MDPNANLEEQRRLQRRIADGADYPATYARLAELADALDIWITNGGFLPNQWQHAANAHRPVQS